MPPKQERLRELVSQLSSFWSPLYRYANWFERYRKGEKKFNDRPSDCVEKSTVISTCNQLKIFILRHLTTHEFYRDVLPYLDGLDDLDIISVASVNKWYSSVSKLLPLLKSIVDDNEFWVRLEPTSAPPSLDSRKIFIVHGRDETFKKRVATFLRRNNLEPIILDEQASGSKAIIEKLEKYTDVGYGVVLYTPCDTADEKKPRARQNVVLEHGYLMAKLGRDKVCALVTDQSIELPGDTSGIIYIRTYEKGVNWKTELIKELQHAGYPVDVDKIIR